MYPLIELATGLLFVAAFLEFGITQATVKWLFVTCLILILTVTDLRVRLLPDVVNWPGFAGGLRFRRLCRRTTDSRGFSFGDSCKCDCQDLGREFSTEFLARLSEAFCF